MKKCTEKDIMFRMADANLNNRLESAEYREIVVWTLSAEVLGRLNGLPMRTTTALDQMGTEESVSKSFSKSKVAWANYFSAGFEDLRSDDKKAIVQASASLKNALELSQQQPDIVRDAVFVSLLKVRMLPIALKYQTNRVLCAIG